MSRTNDYGAHQYTNTTMSSTTNNSTNNSTKKTTTKIGADGYETHLLGAMSKS